jgi:hypothetical protein
VPGGGGDDAGQGRVGGDDALSDRPDERGSSQWCRRSVVGVQAAGDKVVACDGLHGAECPRSGREGKLRTGREGRGKGQVGQRGRASFGSEGRVA